MTPEDHGQATADLTVIGRKWTILYTYERRNGYTGSERTAELVGPPVKVLEPVDVVPAEQLRGAVEERNALLRVALRHLRSDIRGARELVAQDIERFFDRQPSGGSKR